MTKIKSPFDKETYQKNAKIYKILANPKRLEILNIIKKQEAGVDDIAKIIGAKKANISQHLKVLKDYGLVKYRRVGKNILYKIINPVISCALSDYEQNTQTFAEILT